MFLCFGEPRREADTPFSLGALTSPDEVKRGAHYSEAPVPRNVGRGRLHCREDRGNTLVWFTPHPAHQSIATPDFFSGVLLYLMDESSMERNRARGKRQDGGCRTQPLLSSRIGKDRISQKKRRHLQMCVEGSRRLLRCCCRRGNEPQRGVDVPGTDRTRQGDQRLFCLLDGR